MSINPIEYVSVQEARTAALTDEYFARKTGLKMGEVYRVENYALGMIFHSIYISGNSYNANYFILSK
jgi:hypothetical protein